MLAALLAVSLPWGVACGPALENAAQGTQPASNEEAFGGPGMKTCSAVRPKEEPDLMAWDPGSRANLATKADSGVVPVRYVAKGCDVTLEVLSNCSGEGEYEFNPYSSTETKTAHNAQELFAELPLGAVRLQGKVKGDRALRTDYTLVGILALKGNTDYDPAKLTGSDCAKATHVVSRIYIGGFALVSGASSELDAAASYFVANAGGKNEAKAERVAFEGNPKQCQASQDEGVFKPGCNVPLRIGLLSIQGRGAGGFTAECPAGTKQEDGKCVVAVSKSCDAGTEWRDGEGCVAKRKTACDAGYEWSAGEGCVPKRKTGCDAGYEFKAGEGCVPKQAVRPPTQPTPTPEPARPAPSTTGRGPRLIAIPGGSFMMGSVDLDADEKPVHRVTVASFRLDETEVTVAQYRACVSAGECEAQRTVHGAWYEKNGGTEKWSEATCNYGKGDRDRHPMNCVDWSNATNFCRWANKRLPTEEEWEYAARGGDGRKYPWGDTAPSAKLLNACGSECVGWANRTLDSSWSSMYSADDGWPTTAPAGSFSRGDTPQGIHDLAGNVWEWTASRYCPYDNASCSEEMRVDRGGGWGNDDASDVRAANRGRDSPSARNYDLGFRCAQ